MEKIWLHDHLQNTMIYSVIMIITIILIIIIIIIIITMTISHTKLH